MLAQWTRERGFDLVDLVTETRPGARDGFDQLVAAVAGCNVPTVVVPSYGHLALDARRQAAMVDDLEDVGGVVVAMDDLGGRGDRG
ncbi:hypothetical protein AFB00_17390 [Pseudonocardia sp. HH130630-07]|nr:hypothetical protein AFB00_17390 [Pseudonocardia sp. HH130630-07]